MKTPLVYVEADPSWEKSLLNGPFSSRHWMLALCFNALNAINLIQLYRNYHSNEAVASHLFLFILIIAFFLTVGGYYIYKAYEAAKDALAMEGLDLHARKAIVTTSYLAFRLYLIMLGISFITLSAINLANLQ